MNTPHRFSALTASALVACVWFSTAGATNPQAVLNVDGEPDCDSLSPDADIREIKVYRPDQGTASDEHGEQEIYYEVNSDNELSWAVIKGMTINYVILQGKSKKKHKRRRGGGSGGATVYHYGSTPGGNDDSGLVVRPGTHEEGTRIKKLRFCYGFSELEESVVENLKNCDDIDGAQVTCPDESQGPEQRIIVSLDPNKDNFGMVMCTCNLDPDETSGGLGSGVFQQCDPDARQVEDGDAEGGVGGPCSSGTGFVEGAPIDMWGVEDPNSFLCFAISGDRSCFFHFNK